LIGKPVDLGDIMGKFKLIKMLTSFLAVVFLLTACTTTQSDSPFISAEPEAGSVQTRTPQTLRLYFEQLPDVPRSEVTLLGPTGNLNIRGMHTMGANDLMMEINDQVVDGEYTVYWTMHLEEDSNEYQGQYSFSVQTN